MLVLGIVAFVSGALLLASGILARRRRKREERESRERVRQDLAAQLAARELHHPQALVKMDSRGLIRRVNRAAERLFGYDEAELLGQSILRLLPFVPLAFNPAAARVTAVDDHGTAEMEVRCKDRSAVKVRVTASPAESEERPDIYLFFEAVTAEEPPNLRHSQARGAAARGWRAISGREPGSRP
jgi:MprA protease rhombosortase-interaction domain-containing protein